MNDTAEPEGQQPLICRVTPATLAQMAADWRQHESEAGAAAAAVGHDSQPCTYEVRLRNEPRVLLIRWADVLYMT